MTNQTPESVIAEVIEYHADAIGSHYDGCYKHHAVCLAVKLRDMLRELGGPDAATEAVWKEGYDLHTAELVKVAAERDAATAAIERVRALETFSITDSYPAWTAVDHDDLLAALDGAPEPETAPENYEPKCNGACVVHGSPVTNWPVQYGRRNRETGALHWLKGDPLDSWWHENQDNYEHVKRYTSPPLPVEGESK